MNGTSPRRYFHTHIIDFLKSSILPGARVLVVGCPDASFLEALRPSYGVGLNRGNRNAQDFETGKENLVFADTDFKVFRTDTPFDYVIFNDHLTYDDDLHGVFLKMHDLIRTDTKVIVLGVNPNMFLALRLAKALGLHTPKTERNILKLGDLKNLAGLFGYTVVDEGYRFFLPFRLWGLGPLVNSLAARLPVFRHAAFGQYLVLSQSRSSFQQQELSCSVVIPCLNEEGNVRECIERVPDFGLWREIIVVSDGSTDRTAQIVKELMEKRDDLRLIHYERNRGKGYAVKEGWNQSKGDVLMMLDCDMTTPPEELPLFYDAIKIGAEFANGTRIVYPRERRSIPGMNRLGVAFFAALISWITQRRITDTFCGTKVFLRKYWQHFTIEEFLWGDWDLFFMAARFRTKMVEVPVHYKTRKAGEAKMRPFRHGFKLLKAANKGLWIIK